MMKVCFKTETLMLQITAADFTASAAQLITNDKTTKGEKYLKKQKKTSLHLSMCTPSTAPAASFGGTGFLRISLVI